MNNITPFFSVFGLSLLMLSCAEEDAGATCRDVCADQTGAVVSEAEAHDCSIRDERLSDYTAQCRADCVDVIDLVVDPELRDEAVACLECVHDEVSAAPTTTAIAQARDGACFPVCKETGAKQFFSSFFISEPVWDCPGS